MICIHFDRRTNTSRCDGPLFADPFVAHGSDPFFTVARMMTDAGMPDGPATFHDERGMACITVRSIHSCARRYRPTPAEAAARSERAKARRDARGIGRKVYLVLPDGTVK
jgi:hypothetical protein